MTLEIVKSKKWQFDNKRQLIRIGNLKDGFSTFGINVKKINEKIIFQISETELKFEMVKIK